MKKAILISIFGIVMVILGGCSLTGLDANVKIDSATTDDDVGKLLSPTN